MTHFLFLSVPHGRPKNTRQFARLCPPRDAARRHMRSPVTLMRTWLARWTKPQHTPLGRWCHPTSDVYARACNQEMKGDLNTYDHGFHTLRARPFVEKATEDPQ